MERWSRADDALWRHSVGELIALGDGEPVRLNATGAVLWQQLAEPATTHELAIDLADRFDTTPDDIVDEVAAVVRHLADLGLVTKR